MFNAPYGGNLSMRPLLKRLETAVLWDQESCHLRPRAVSRANNGVKGGPIAGSVMGWGRLVWRVPLSIPGALLPRA